MCRKGMQEGGREGGMKGGKRAVKDNRVAAFISLWIYIWDGRTENDREGGQDREIDTGKEGWHLI